jgi:hypothetical protein
MWNTGYNVVYNRTLYVVDSEDTSQTLLVPPDDESSSGETILPWVDRHDEGDPRALRTSTTRLPHRGSATGHRNHARTSRRRSPCCPDGSVSRAPSTCDGVRRWRD